MGVAAIAALALVGCGGGPDSNTTTVTEPAPPPPTESAAPIEAASLVSLLANNSRAAEDRERDAVRKPAEVIDVLGIEPGMRVIDLIAAGGYYTEVLSLAVGPDGHVSAQNPAVVLEMQEGANEKAISARLANNRLPNVSRVNAELPDFEPTDGLYDAALTALNLHDIYGNYGEEGAIGAMKNVYALLKPGGVFGVIDHMGAAGNDNKSMHRMTVADAIRVAEAAGFVVETNSGILHIHSDDMSQPVFADSVRGKTNRFLLKLRKPVG